MSAGSARPGVSARVAVLLCFSLLCFAFTPNLEVLKTHFALLCFGFFELSEKSTLLCFAFASSDILQILGIYRHFEEILDFSGEK